MKKRKQKVRPTPLNRRKVVKGKITSEWDAIRAVAPMREVSWYHDFLPDYLWLVLALNFSPRNRVMAAFRQAYDGLEKIKLETGVRQLSHAGLADLNDLEFAHVVDPFLRDLGIKESLRPLLAFESLPGFERWRSRLGIEKDSALELVEDAVRNAASQNSSIATDIAFFNFMALVAQDKFRIAPGLMRMSEINDFAADPSSAPKLAGMVRALRNGWGDYNRVEAGHTRDWVDRFYETGRRETQCKGLYPTSNASAVQVEDRMSRLLRLVEEIHRKCSINLTERFQLEGYDESVEVISSLGLYACDIALAVAHSSQITHSYAAILLRSLAEINISISFLKMSPQIVGRYRAYGSGRASLLSEKADEAGASASYLLVPELKAVANERRASEYIDMPLTAFFEKSVRDTAIEVGAKDVYDAYYDVGSMYSHAEWGGVATSSVQMCLNPLHLGHYIPSVRLFSIEMMDDVYWLMARVDKELSI